MHSQTIRALQQDHSGPDLRRHERRTLWVVGLTAVMMVAEIAAGWWTGSMALLADGWHMATHAGALGLSALAYWFARARAADRSFSFGTGKVYALAGYTSAVALLIAAVWMCVESVSRFITPTDVAFDEALPIAVIGLVVNIASALVLGHGHDHHDHGHDGVTHAQGRDRRRHDHADHDHAGHAHHDHDRADHDHGGHRHDDHDHADHDREAHPHERHAGDSHHHAARAERADPHDRPAAQARANAGATAVAPHHDPNLRAAYLHVLADAFTSVLAIAALVAGRWLDWRFLDPAMGIVGGVIIARWSIVLCRDAARHLLDVSSSTQNEARIQARLESIDDVRVADLHLWDLGPGRCACVVSVVTASPRETEHYRQAVREVVTIDHLTIEVHRCPDHEHEKAPCSSADKTAGAALLTS